METALKVIVLIFFILTIIFIYGEITIIKLKKQVKYNKKLLDSQLNNIDFKCSNEINYKNDVNSLNISFKFDEEKRVVAFCNLVDELDFYIVPFNNIDNIELLRGYIDKKEKVEITCIRISINNSKDIINFAYDYNSIKTLESNKLNKELKEIIEETKKIIKKNEVYV